MTPLFYVGGRIILARGFDVEESLRIIREEQCTVILGVPTLFQMWRDTPEYEIRRFQSRALLHQWRRALSGPPHGSLAQKEKGVVFRGGMALTEVGPNCFSMTDEDSVPKSGSVGKRPSSIVGDASGWS
ncbi:MAG: AMP-binding protein [Chloroflexota bacterium]